MSPDPHRVFEELTAGFALSALEPVEEQSLLLHLPGCNSCAREVHEFTVLAEAFAFAAQDAAPPARVWAGILAGIGASPR